MIRGDPTPGTAGPGARPRGLLLAGGAVALLAGLTGALVLLGLPMPAVTLRLGVVHGLLMTFGFLGTLVSLERAVALGRGWGYLAPLASALGALALLLGADTAGTWLFVVAGVAFAGIYAAFDRIERSLHGTVQAGGAAAWLGGAILLALGRPIESGVPWIAAFLILTVVGERLELSRVTRPSEFARQAFGLACLVLLAGVLLSAVVADPGTRLAGAGILGLAAWLGRFDIARRTVRARGVTRFIAASLLPGYAWLAVGGAIWLAVGQPVGSGYDASLHALFLGFVMSMVFGHAPLILPAVLRLPLPYRPRFYAHLALLHLGLLVRIGTGDLLGIPGAWQLGGLLNVTALLVFLASSVAAALEGRRERPPMSRRAGSARTGPAGTDERG
ncbi:MAG TPA: hypothetical protein VF763_06860 [Candidatus Limnocylindrales bacterium]